MNKCFQEDISEIFRVADVDRSGTLTLKEIKDVLGDICERYPQVELYLKSKQMKNFVDLLRDSEGNPLKESKELDIEEFKKALIHVDSQVKMLPATAQVIFLIIITDVGDRTGAKRLLQFIYEKLPLEDSAKSSPMSCYYRLLHKKVIISLSALTR